MSKTFVMVKYIHSRIEYEFSDDHGDEQPELKSTMEEKIIMLTETNQDNVGFNDMSKGMFEHWKEWKLYKMSFDTEHLVLIDYKYLN